MNKEIAATIAGLTALSYAKRTLWDGMINLPSLKGEIALITGGSGGLGLCLAEELLNEGATVVLWDISSKALDAAKEGLIKKLQNSSSASLDPPSIHTYVCDITNREKVYETAAAVRKDVGHVTVLFNNAGVMPASYLMEESDDVIERTIKVNTLALFWVTKAFLPHLLQRKKGYIVNVASTAGMFAAPQLVGYCASKAGAVGFSRTLRLELNKLGMNIGVTCICPYAIKTPLSAGWKHPFGMSSLQPEQVAKNIIWHMKMQDDVVLMPDSMYFAFYNSLLLPNLYNAITTKLGMLNVTATFQGRGKEFIMGTPHGNDKLAKL